MKQQNNVDDRVIRLNQQKNRDISEIGTYEIERNTKENDMGKCLFYS